MMEMTMMKSIVWVVVMWATIQWVVSEKVLRRRRRHPPGPTPLPIIGNLHNLITNKPHKALAELAKIHGPLMLLRLGFLNAVIVSSPEVAREVLQKKDVLFCNRMAPNSFNPHLAENAISMMPVGDRWRTLRKIVNTLLLSSKNLDANQEIRMKKIEDLVSNVSSSSKAGVAVNIGQVTFDASLNLLSNTIFSFDLADPNSELSREFKQITWGIVRDAGIPNLADFFPILNRFDPQGLTRQMTSHFDKCFKLFDEIIEKRLNAIKNGATEGVDVLDILLKICRDKSEDLELFQIRHMLVDLFVAGTETTSSTVEWAMAELLREPTKLKEATEEVHRVVGKGNFVEEADIARLPYLQAVIKETFRLHPAVPLLVPRKADTETEVHGFMVPEGSQLLVNVWAIGRDPTLWKNPNKFEPERFFNSEVDVKGTHYELIPFGSGRRICIGISLATRILPIMLGNLINFFNWKLEDGLEPKDMDMDDKFGLALQKAKSLYAVPLMFN